MRKALFIGGTGTISGAITALASRSGFELTLLNRGHNKDIPAGVRQITADINDEAAVAKLLENESFDIVADFIVFTTKQLERDIRLFTGKTRQYIVISSASAYQSPLNTPFVNESTPLRNPYWQYSRDKIAIEDRVIKEYRDKAFPATIIRPSHTYCEKSVPVCLHGSKGSWQVVKRIMDDKPVIIPGDGLTWWTLTYNTDFAKAFVGIMGNSHALGEVFQITSDECLTWNMIHEIIAGALGKKLRPVHISADMLCRVKPEWEGSLLGDKSLSIIFDNTKIKRFVPGFVCSVNADEGIRRALDYVLSHPECQIPDPEFDQVCDKLITAYENFGAVAN
ncbi:MAG: NAD-dependent epimerase/dehydratase family protein [Clostridiales bacterium]|jgi:nucleoside-diphosphate-sugar epimerase|nr:NAD-dependent epimerase/dehydratase family protein [Clostridiales bacterium]